MKYFETLEKFLVFDPRSEEQLSIDKTDFKISKIKHKTTDVPCLHLSNWKDCEFVVGALLYRHYGCVFLCESSTEMGKIYGDKRVKRVKKITPKIIQRNVPFKYPKLAETEFTALKIAIKTITKRSFIYSDDFDLTLKTEQIFQNGNETGLDCKDNENFFRWNQNLLGEFLSVNAGAFTRSLVNGYFDYRDTSADANGNLYRIAIISRRSWKRDGMRLTSRGADDYGNVSNFVETEIILEERKPQEIKISVRGICILRGSMPFQWEQERDLSWKPEIRTKGKTVQNYEILEKHFLALQKMYGRVIAVNLVNKSGAESKLENLYQNLIKEYNCMATINNKPKVDYIGFDFHKQCPGTNLENMKSLLKLFDKREGEMGFRCVIHCSKDGKKEKFELVSNQKTVLRINCMDNLDRTNYVQSYLVKHILKTDVGFSKELENGLTFLWAENGDFLSQQYAGTEALKSELTRTGRRTNFGLIKDGLKSLKRYFLNNFYDGEAQDGINILTGRWSASNLPADSTGIEFGSSKKWRFNAFAATAAFVCAFALQKFNENLFLRTCVSLLLGTVVGVKANVDEVLTEKKTIYKIDRSKKTK